MRIGIDGSCLSNRRGFGRFTRRLVSAIAEVHSAHEFVVFVDRPSAASVVIPSHFERIIVEMREAPSKAASAGGRRRWRDMFAMGLAVARSRIDLMYFPATYSFFPVWNVPKLVVTMHDTLPFAYPELVFPGGKGSLAWRLKETAAARWADRIVTVSEASRMALQASSGWCDGRIRVITEGPDPIFRPRAGELGARAALERYGIPPERRYLLYVGGLSPHKNLLRLVDAFARTAEQDTVLVLVGEFNDVFHTHVPEIRAAIVHHGLGDRVIMPGFVPDDDLVFLYSRAAALVLPSLMEGFGLPAVEAMACGTPVVSSRAGSLPEVVGDAGVYFDPTDVGSIVTAIESVVNDQLFRESLAQRAIHQAALFTWDASARALLACFDELVQAPKRQSAIGRSA